jgi:hypothetical protein
MGQKKQKKVPRVPLLALGEEVLPRVLEQWLSGKRLLPWVPVHGTRGRGHLPRVLEHGTRRRLCFQIFGKRLRPMLPSNANFLLRVPLSPECCTRGRWLSPSATLPWVPWVLQHSGKPLFPEKIGFPECPIFGTRERVWHSGNFSSPVVRHASRGTVLACHEVYVGKNGWWQFHQ